MNERTNLLLRRIQRKTGLLYRCVLRCLWFVYVIAILMTTACTQSSEFGGGEITLAATEPANDATVSATKTSPAPVLPTPVPLQLQSPVATIMPTIRSTPTSNSSTVSLAITGKLLFATDVGIKEVSLPNGNSRYLLRKESNWTEWGATFGQNKKVLAYWMAYEDKREVWVTPLQDNWQPERILIIENDSDAWSMGNWMVNDRYVLTSAAALDESSLLEDYVIVKTYIYDIQMKKPVAEPYWPGSCMILAPSPRTQQLALWCSQSEGTSHPQYLVLEPETSPWIAEQTPQQLSEDCHSLLCAWSADGNYVAYIIDEHVPESLYYSTVDTSMTVHLKDDENDFLRSPLWSPNSAYILYYGASMNRPNQYTKISSIGTPEVVWRGVDTNEELGLDFRELAVWSPDSRYIARAAFSFLEDKNLIVLEDISIGREVGRVNTGLNPITDMIWLETPLK